MKIEDEQRTALTLCLLLLSRLIACSLSAALRRRRDARPTRPPRGRSGAGVGNHPSPARHKAGSRLPAQHRRGDVSEWQKWGKGGNKPYTPRWRRGARADSRHLPEAQHSSPQHGRCRSWGLIHPSGTYRSLSRQCLNELRIRGSDTVSRGLAYKAVTSTLIQPDSKPPPRLQGESSLHEERPWRVGDSGPQCDWNKLPTREKHVYGKTW